jgi:hypothetical protein
MLVQAFLVFDRFGAGMNHFEESLAQKSREINLG